MNVKAYSVNVSQRIISSKIYKKIQFPSKLIFIIIQYIKLRLDTSKVKYIATSVYLAIVNVYLFIRKFQYKISFLIIYCEL